MEQHLVLYRQFRPINFDQVIGQDHIVNALKNQVKSGQIGHAYLFTGSRGTGKTSSAKIFARAINCLNNQDGSPCGECEVCKALEDSVNMDVVEIDAASNNSVEDVRDMIANLKFLPVNGKYKVFIIDEVHMLSLSAFNALLKSIEEPPKHIVFILATTEVHKVPATILSRVMRFDFKLINTNDLEKLLVKIFNKTGIKADEESIKAIARAGEGSVRDTLSTAECVAAYAYKDITYQDVQNALGYTDKSVLLKIIGSIINRDLAGIFESINSVYLAGKSMSVLSKDLTTCIRDLLVMKSCSEPNKLLGLPNDLFDKYMSLSKGVSSDVLLKCLQKFTAVEQDMRYTINPKILLEITCLDCVGLSSSDAVITNSVVNTNENKSVEATKVESKSSEETTKVESNTVAVKYDKHKIWGSLVNKLRENGYIVLSSICGGILNVDIEGNLFIVNCEKQSDKDSLSKETNFKVLVDILRELGYSFDVEIRKLITREDINNEHIDALRDMFGDKLKVEN